MLAEHIAWRDAQGGAVSDARYFPVTITTWFGHMSESVVRSFFAWSDAMALRAQTEGTRFVTITDSRQVVRPPATIRKLITELTDGGPDAAHTANLLALVVIDSPLVRGALTAMQWISRREWPVVTVGTMAEAITRSLRALASAGLRAPTDLDPNAWVVPTLPEALGTTVLGGDA